MGGQPEGDGAFRGAGRAVAGLTDAQDLTYLDDALALVLAVTLVLVLVLAEAEGTPGAGVVATGSISIAGEVRTLFGRG
jgi:hypothetical protein